MEREEKVIMNKELQLRLKDNLVVTSFDGEGLVFEMDTRKTFWINETAAFLFTLLQTNNEGISLSSIRSLVQKQYLVEDGNEVTRDLISFINRLEGFGLVSLHSQSNEEIKLRKPNSKPMKPYTRPIIEEETGILSVQGNIIRAAHTAAARSAAVSRATAAGFRGFR